MAPFSGQRRPAAQEAEGEANDDADSGDGAIAERGIDALLFAFGRFNAILRHHRVPLNKSAASGDLISLRGRPHHVIIGFVPVISIGEAPRRTASAWLEQAGRDVE